MVETTALGAAGLAGIAAGVWTTAEEFVGSRPEPTLFTPARSAHDRDLLHDGWARAIDATLHWASTGKHN